MHNKGLFSSSSGKGPDDESTELDDIRDEGYRHIVLLELVRNNDETGVKRWLQNPACRVDETDQFGNCAVTIAASNNNFMILAMLVEAHANLNVTDAAEHSPLHYAQENENDDMVEFIQSKCPAAKFG
jgi:ankyrin repeat protein